MTGVSAGTQVVLEDGQVLEGADVRREGDLYIIELESGGVLTIPVSLVKQVRLSSDGEKKEPPPGLTYAEPRQLAGPPVEPLRPSEAQEVFGEPSRFRPNVIDPTWEPESGFPDGDVLAGSRSTWQPSVIDPTWTPESGFPDGDVLKDSRSTWTESIVDNKWVPEDGFKKRKMSWQHATGQVPTGARVRLTSARTLAPQPTPDRALAAAQGWYEGFSSTRSGVPFRFKLSTRPRRSATAVRDCAKRVLQASGPVAVEALEDERYANLPIHVYRAAGLSGEKKSRAVFTVEGGTCRAISGDLRDPLGVRLTRSYTRVRGVEAFDAALEEPRAVLLSTAEDKIDYAFAVVSLTDPDVNGRREASLALLQDRKDLEALTSRDPEECSLSGSKRKKSARKVARMKVAPRVVVVDGREKVELVTWSSSEGEIVRHSVLLAKDGKVSVESESVASHVGAHTDRD
jgi:hypothetical protein